MTPEDLSITALCKSRQIQSRSACHIYPDLQQPVCQILGVDVMTGLVRCVGDDHTLCVKQLNDKFVAFCGWVLSSVVVEPLRLVEIEFLELREELFN